MARIVASHEPQLLQKVETMACVRDLFDDPTPPKAQEKQQNLYSGAFKQLVEWMEWSKMHGIDHFLVYTFQGTGVSQPKTDWRQDMDHLCGRGDGQQWAAHLPPDGLRSGCVNETGGGSRGVPWVVPWVVPWGSKLGPWNGGEALERS
eukprot:Skav218870  [mRNA]  locus=scaffold843:70573:74265:- [translate_table: standard]